MPSLLYQVDDRQTYRQLRRVPLAGTRGPLYKHMQAVCPDEGKWHLPESRMLELLDVADPARHAVVIDLKPSQEGNVSLFRIRDVWGCRAKSWCPLALRLETLYVDHIVSNSRQFKREFVPDRNEHKIVHEFLYIRGESSWTWGRVGMVNGALLWPDAYKYFVTEIERTWPE